MSKTVHTPTPWSATGLTIEADCNGITVAQVRGVDNRARGKERMEDLEYCQGNAAFIVRACNSHDQLVTALTACLKRLVADCADKSCVEIMEARAALTAAGVA